MPAAAHLGSWCHACTYPPCAGGCGAPRPPKSANHAKHRPFWRCEKCAAQVCTKCAKKPVGRRPGQRQSVRSASLTSFVPGARHPCLLKPTSVRGARLVPIRHAPAAAAHRAHAPNTWTTTPKHYPRGPAKPAWPQQMAPRKKGPERQSPCPAPTHPCRIQTCHLYHHQPLHHRTHLLQIHTWPQPTAEKRNPGPKIKRPYKFTHRSLPEPIVHLEPIAQACRPKRQTCQCQTFI